jgi:hypothetical protein
MAGSVITAGTTRTQAGATLITEDVTTINTSTAPAAGSLLGDGVVLPQVGAGSDRVFLINNTANPVQVYGFLNPSGTSDTINGVAGATGIAMAPLSADVYIEAAPGAWAVDAGYGSSGQLQTMLSLNGITAHAGGGQASATPLPAMLNRVTTVATIADSVLMPAAVPGLEIMIVNASANSMNVFPAGTDQINALGASAAFAMAAAKVEVLYCVNSGQWHSNP